jgi:hypothetical protein
MKKLTLKDLIKEEIYSMLNENTLNKEEYMKKLLDMETPYTRSKENIDMLIKIYNSQIQALNYIKKDLK